MWTAFPSRIDGGSFTLCCDTAFKISIKSLNSNRFVLNIESCHETISWQKTRSFSTVKNWVVSLYRSRSIEIFRPPQAELIVVVYRSKFLPFFKRQVSDQIIQFIPRNPMWLCREHIRKKSWGFQFMFQWILWWFVRNGQSFSMRYWANCRRYIMVVYSSFLLLRDSLLKW